MRLRPDIPTATRLKRIKLVLMDVDGTLVTGDSQTFAQVIDQLRRLKSVGIHFSIATGRTISGVAPILAQLDGVGVKMPPMITYNGAVVAVGEMDLVLKVRTIEREAFAHLVKRCRIIGVSPLAYACAATPFESIRETVYSESTNAPLREFNGTEIRRVTDLLAIEDEIVAALIECPAGAIGDAFKESLAQSFSGALRVTTSGGPYIEICHPLGTKQHAMFELAEMMRIGVDEIMAIGDNFNDLEMIGAAGVGVAVANAPDSVKNAAFLRCSQKDARGVVEALRVLMRVKLTERAHAKVEATRLN